jgi:hypothetical protein
VILIYCHFANVSLKLNGVYNMFLIVDASGVYQGRNSMRSTAGLFNRVFVLYRYMFTMLVAYVLMLFVDWFLRSIFKLAMTNTE